MPQSARCHGKENQSYLGRLIRNFLDVTTENRYIFYFQSGKRMVSWGLIASLLLEKEFT